MGIFSKNQRVVPDSTVYADGADSVSRLLRSTSLPHRSLLRSSFFLSTRSILTFLPRPSTLLFFSNSKTLVSTFSQSLRECFRWKKKKEENDLPLSSTATGPCGRRNSLLPSSSLLLLQLPWYFPLWVSLCILSVVYAKR